MVFILLPPSEGKTTPTSGGPVDLPALSYPELTEARTRVIEALTEASAGGPGAINAPPSTAAEVEANIHLLQAPTAPASEVYTGVLYAAAGLTDLPRTAAERARAHVRIASTVFGFLAPSDEIPAYRLPPAAKLPGIGAPIPFLSPEVSEVMDAQAPRLVLDCRSGPYVRLWRPTCPWVHVKAVEMRAGEPVVVSHFAKHHRGVLTRHLLTRNGELPATVDEVAQAARELLGIEYAEVTLAEGKPGTHVLELTLLS